jgi:cbb3-type cytochrome oxidase maturation protein
MTSLLLLIPCALLLGACGLAAFLWALRSGQFDDPDGAANRILFDDPPRGLGADCAQLRQAHHDRL